MYLPSSTRGITIMSQYEETLVGKIIHEKIPIEWMRYNMYIEDDKYRNIPMLVFRVQDSCPNSMIEELKKVLIVLRVN